MLIFQSGLKRVLPARPPSSQPQSGRQACRSRAPRMFCLMVFVFGRLQITTWPASMLQCFNASMLRRDYLFRRIRHGKSSSRCLSIRFAAPRRSSRAMCIRGRCARKRQRSAKGRYESNALPSFAACGISNDFEASAMLAMPSVNQFDRRVLWANLHQLAETSGPQCRVQQ